MSLIYKMQFGISKTQIFKSQARSFDWKWKCLFLASLSKSLKIIVKCKCFVLYIRVAADIFGQMSQDLYLSHF